MYNIVLRRWRWKNVYTPAAGPRAYVSDLIIIRVRREWPPSRRRCRTSRLAGRPAAPTASVRFITSRRTRARSPAVSLSHSRSRSRCLYPAIPLIYGSGPIFSRKHRVRPSMVRRPVINSLRTTGPGFRTSDAIRMFSVISTGASSNPTAPATPGTRIRSATRNANVTTSS